MQTNCAMPVFSIATEAVMEHHELEKVGYVHQNLPIQQAILRGRSVIVLEPFEPAEENLASVREKPASRHPKKKMDTKKEAKRKRIDDSTIYPYRCIGRVETCFELDRTLGTGFFVGPRHILTAAHNVYDFEKKQYAQSIFFRRCVKRNT